MCTALIHMYHTERVDMPEGLRSVLNIFVVVTRRTDSQYIQNMFTTFNLNDYPLHLPIYRLMCEIMYYFIKPEHAFSRDFFVMEWSLIAIINNCVCSHVNHIDWIK